MAIFGSVPCPGIVCRPCACPWEMTTEVINWQESFKMALNHRHMTGNGTCATVWFISFSPPPLPLPPPPLFSFLSPSLLFFPYFFHISISYGLFYEIMNKGIDWGYWDWAHEWRESLTCIVFMCLMSLLLTALRGCILDTLYDSDIIWWHLVSLRWFEMFGWIWTSELPLSPPLVPL